MRPHSNLIKFWADNADAKVYWLDNNQWVLLGNGFPPQWSSGITYVVVLPKYNHFFEAFKKDRLYRFDKVVTTFPIITDKNAAEFRCYSNLEVGSRVLIRDCSESIVIVAGRLHPAIDMDMSFVGTLIVKDLSYLPSFKVGGNGQRNNAIVLAGGYYIYTQEKYLEGL